jgi:hypothetical protein
MATWNQPDRGIVIRAIMAKSGPVRLFRLTRAALANVPEANWLDHTGLDRATLLRLATDVSREVVQVRGPGEKSGREPSVELASHPPIGMEIAKRSPPPA